VHLIDTPTFFALTAKHRPFCRFGGKNAKIRASKKPTVGFFEQRLRQ